MKNILIGKTVYFLHPQSHLKPHTVISGTISTMCEKTTKTLTAGDTVPCIIKSEFVYNVRLKPSGTLIERREEDIFFNAEEAASKAQEEVDLIKSELEHKLEILKVRIEL